MSDRNVVLFLKNLHRLLEVQIVEEFNKKHAK